MKYIYTLLTLSFMFFLNNCTFQPKIVTKEYKNIKNIQFKDKYIKLNLSIFTLDEYTLIEIDIKKRNPLQFILLDSTLQTISKENITKGYYFKEIIIGQDIDMQNEVKLIELNKEKISYQLNIGKKYKKLDIIFYYLNDDIVNTYLKERKKIFNYESDKVNNDIFLQYGTPIIIDDIWL